jgi:Thioredoxin-like [2Fe-2S] ferredoxin
MRDSTGTPPTPEAKPAEDFRLDMVNRTMRLHHNQPHALIETLNAVQESFGFLDEDVLRYVASSLRVPLSRVYAVATLYHSFALKPQGEHTCGVCRRHRLLHRQCRRDHSRRQGIASRCPLHRFLWSGAGWSPR